MGKSYRPNSYWARVGCVDVTNLRPQMAQPYLPPPPPPHSIMTRKFLTNTVKPLGGGGFISGDDIILTEPLTCPTVRSIGASGELLYNLQFDTCIQG